MGWALLPHGRGQPALPSYRPAAPTEVVCHPALHGRSSREGVRRSFLQRWEKGMWCLSSQQAPTSPSRDRHLPCPWDLGPGRGGDPARLLPSEAWGDSWASGASGGWPGCESARALVTPGQAHGLQQAGGHTEQGGLAAGIIHPHFSYVLMVLEGCSPAGALTQPPWRGQGSRGETPVYRSSGALLTHTRGFA